jgi:putative transposase
LRRPVESAQYLSIRYTDRLAEVGAAASVGSRGDSYDNALAESVFSLYKAELITMQGPWRTVEDVELATLAWVSWWNTQDSTPPSAMAHQPSSRHPTTLGYRPSTPAVNAKRSL